VSDQDQHLHRHQEPITENSPTRIKEASIVAVAMLSGALWINTRLSGVEHSNERLAERLNNIERLAQDAASKSDLRNFAADLADDNPTVKVPKVR